MPDIGIASSLLLNEVGTTGGAGPSGSITWGPDFGESPDGNT